MISWIKKLLGMCDHSYKEILHGRKLYEEEGVKAFFFKCKKCGNMKIVKTQ